MLRLDTQWLMQKTILMLSVFSAVLVTGCGGTPVSIAPRPTETARFVVLAETDEGRSLERFIIELNEPERIAQARLLVQQNGGGKMVFGSIQNGNGGYNVDPISGRSWSWRLDPQSVRFVDATAEIYNTWPGGIEGNLAYWLNLGKVATGRLEEELPRGF